MRQLMTGLKDLGLVRKTKQLLTANRNETMTTLDINRHVDVFSPDAFDGKTIDVIGAGATGSRIVLSLAKLGLLNIRVWDFDEVEAHNIANQAYSLDDIGTLKVEALQKLVKQQTGTKIEIHPEAVDGTQELGDVVFLLTDTMASRKEIWKKGLRYKTRTRLMIETRMGSDEGRVYTIEPKRPKQVKGWEETLYDDVETEVSACGTSISVGPTAEYLSGLAVWQFIRWHAINSKQAEDKVDHELIFGMRAPFIISRSFE